MSKLLDLRSKKKKSLSSFKTRYEPIFINMKKARIVNDRYFTKFTYNINTGNIDNVDTIRIGLHTYFLATLSDIWDCPKDLKFESQRNSDIQPMSKMYHYSSTRIYH